MNQVILIGRLTKDPELRYTPIGSPVCQCTIAVDNYNSKTKERAADFIPLVIWGKQAENTATHMLKGSQIAVSGRLRTRSYDDKDKIKRFTTEVVVSQIKFISNKNSGNPSNPDDLELVNDDNDGPF